MEMFHMTEIIPLLGLPYPNLGVSNYYVRCPCCDDSPHKEHLNINFVKDVFRCPRCGVSGGVLDLYSLFTDIPRAKANQAIKERLRPSEGIERPQHKILPPSQNESVRECPLTDIDTRHQTYTAFLSKLSLAGDHRENLLKRGLTDQDIESLGYKTTPVVGMAVLTNQLHAEGYYLAGVPGFYRAAKDFWTFVHEQRGILIPVRDVQGRIQGLQIRRDNVEKRKFRWVSSGEKKDGCKAEGWTHLSGSPAKKLIITEGPMKADVIHALTGLTVLAVPGVNTLTRLKVTLEELQDLGLEEIKTAFDMDFLTNQYVRDGYNNLLCLLDEMGFKFGTYLWDPGYKGLDDYIWAEKQKRKGVPIKGAF